MQTVFSLCKPRESVFSDTARDDTLNLSDLIEGKINASRFFDENFKTKGIRDRYQHLLLTIRVGEKGYDDLDQEYLALEHEKHSIYKDLPTTSDKAVKIASKALKIKKG